MLGGSQAPSTGFGFGAQSTAAPTNNIFGASQGGNTNTGAFGSTGFGFGASASAISGTGNPPFRPIKVNYAYKILR